MYILKDKFTVDEITSEAINKLVINEGASIYDNETDTIMKISSRSEIYTPYNPSFVYFDCTTKMFNVYRSDAEFQNKIKLFEVKKLNNVITEIKDMQEIEASDIILSSIDSRLESIQNEVDGLEVQITNIANIQNTQTQSNIDGGYF